MWSYQKYCSKNLLKDFSLSVGPAENTHNIRDTAMFSKD